MKTLIAIIILLVFTRNSLQAQSVTLTPQGNTLTQFSLSTTIDISQTGAPSISQLIYNINPAITGSNANGIGYYYWNGANWQSLDANIPSGTIVFSETHPNQALINSSLSMIGTSQINAPALDVWRNVDTTNILSKRSVTSIFCNNKFFVWGGNNGSFLRNGRFYDPILDIWTTINTLNSPTTSLSALTLKDLVIYSGDNINDCRIFNPEANNWTSVSSFNAPSLTRNDWENMQYDTTSNKVFWWNSSQSKIFDASNNTWVNISMTNAPNTGNLRKRFGDYILISNGTEGAIYNLETDTWLSIVIPTFVNLGDVFWNGTKLIFAKRNFENQTMEFSVYNPITNVLEPNWQNLSSIYSEMKYIGKFETKNIFTGNNSVLFYDENTNIWDVSNYLNQEGLSPYTKASFIKLCGSNLIFYASNQFASIGGYPQFFDGMKLNMLNSTWSYMPPLFGRNSSSSYCCSDKYLFTFGGGVSTFGSQPIFNNRAGIFQLSGLSNQTAQKTMYLYKKN